MTISTTMMMTTMTTTTTISTTTISTTMMTTMAATAARRRTLPVTRCIGLAPLKAASASLLATPTITSRLVSTPPDEGLIITHAGVPARVPDREAAGMLTGDRSAATVAAALVLRARKMGHRGDVGAAVVRFVAVAAETGGHGAMVAESGV
jgi:hypothetical protein